MEAEKAQKKSGGTGLDEMPRHGPSGWMKNIASRIQLEKDRTLGPLGQNVGMRSSW